MSMGTEIVPRELVEKYNVVIRIRDEAARAGLQRIVMVCDEIIDEIVKQIAYEVKKALTK